MEVYLTMDCDRPQRPDISRSDARNNSFNVRGAAARRLYASLNLFPRLSPGGPGTLARRYFVPSDLEIRGIGEAGRLRDGLENSHRYWINPEQPEPHTARAALPQTARVSP